MGEGLDFFISYTQADLQRAEWIASVLKEAGYKVRFQAWDFTASRNFVVEMERAILEAERTIAVLSPDYPKSKFAMAEWAAAFAQDPTGEKGKLLPVRVREMTPTGLLAQIVYLDLVGLDKAAARKRLLDGAAKDRSHPEAAQMELKGLPLDEIPGPGPLPAGSCMPLSVNPLFIGRDDDLRALARQLKAGETSAIGQVEIAAATGMGGIGKTQLAAEFVHRYGRYFAGGVFWLSFADPAGVPSEVAASGRGLNLSPSFDDLPLDQQVRLVEDAWKRPIPRLLVFDNCEDPGLLARWRPNHGGARVLVTSRRSHWDRSLGVKTVALGTLKRSDSIKLLHSFRPDLAADEPSLDEIAAELGDLPLALHLAGSFLARYEHAPFGQPAAYLEQLRKGDILDHPSLQGKGSDFLPTEHGRHVAKTFALSYEKLNPEDPIDALAQALLARAAYFVPSEPIPRNLLLATVGISLENGDLRTEDALDRLIAVGFLKKGEEGSLLMHRLVAIFSRGFNQEDNALIAVEEAMIKEAQHLVEEGRLGLLLPWQSHLRSIADAAKVREDKRAALLCKALANYFHAIGNDLEAIAYLEIELAINEKTFGPEHPNTANSMNNLGCLHLCQGSYPGALEYYERALAIWETALGSDHVRTGLVLNNLGLALERLQCYSEAGDYFKRALSILEKELGPKDPRTQGTLRHLVLLTDRTSLKSVQPGITSLPFFLKEEKS